MEKFRRFIGVVILLWAGLAPLGIRAQTSNTTVLATPGKTAGPHDSNVADVAPKVAVASSNLAGTASSTLVTSNVWPKLSVAPATMPPTRIVVGLTNFFTVTVS